MRNLFIFLLLIICAGIVSCQKEIDGTILSTSNSGGTNPLPSTSGDVVVKVYGKPSAGLDSNITYYTYNSAKKVVSRHILLNAYGCSVDNWDWFERNAAGLIIRSKQYQVSTCNPQPADTAVTLHHYSTGANPTLLSSVKVNSLFTDSLVYTYDNSGRTVKIEDYQSGFLTASPTLIIRNVFTYDAAGNEIKNESYSITGTIATLIGTQTFEWDNKTEPTGYTEGETLIISSRPAAKHNNTKVTIVNLVANSINTYKYTYNSANKPTTSVMTSVNIGYPTTTTNFTIYYQ